MLKAVLTREKNQNNTLDKKLSLLDLKLKYLPSFRDGDTTENFY